MSEVQLHRIGGGSYSFGNTSLTLFRNGKKWLCGYLVWEDDTPESRWYERNIDLFDIQFRTMQEARAYISALLDQDPAPEDELLPARCLKRIIDGSGEYYEVKVGEARYAARRNPSGRWALSCLTQHALPEEPEYESLWHLRLNLGDFVPRSYAGGFSGS